FQYSPNFFRARNGRDWATECLRLQGEVALSMFDKIRSLSSLTGTITASMRQIMSSNFYMVCDFGEEVCRLMSGTLHMDKLVMTEPRRFQNVPVNEKGSLQWNIPQLYRELLDGLREIGAHEE